MNFRKVFAIFGEVCAIFNYAVATLATRPVDSEVVVGRSAFFNCSTCDQYSINWQHIPVGSKTTNDVYISRRLLYPYNQRCEMDVNITTGRYNLKIRSAIWEDAGTYICIDGAGHGEQAQAELIALDGPPNCQTKLNLSDIVGDSHCGIQTDNLHVRCSLNFSGSIVPRMEWKLSSGDEVIPKTVWIEKTTNAIIYTVDIKPDQTFDGSSVIGVTKLSKYNWTSETLKVWYALDKLSSQIINEPKEIICEANSNLHCDYLWVRITEEGTDKVCFNQSCFLQKQGNYSCLSECHLQERICTVQSALIEYKADGSMEISITILLLILLATVQGVLLIISIPCLIIIKRKLVDLRRKQETKCHSNENRIQESKETCDRKRQQSRESGFFEPLQNRSTDDNEVQSLSMTQRQMSKKKAENETDHLFLA